MAQPRRNKSTSAADLPTGGTDVVGTQDPSQPLTGMQRLFVTMLVHEKLNQTIAAREAGYNQPGTAAHALMRNPKVIHAIAEEREAYAAASAITKKNVVDGMLEAIEMAKTLGEPASMISGWREVGKLCGFYEPSLHKLEITAKGAALLSKLEAMSDEELLAAADDNIIDGEYTEMDAA